ncbi:MAG: glycerophosphodiester phosphodiesterase family protein [Chloroflexota bacterium]|nr:glycerophosphodiester phosphodiesterase family protein [Chloroflexota bacterium]MDE2946386.1 glycerophosphodiester phosphodiesterase family protein [Chloroflexota bacterium]
MPQASIIEALSSDETLVFGHRGALAQAPMNTLAAFDCARQQGADGIELDLQLSRDGHLVVIHDYTVDATTDGHGDVAEMSLAELKRLDAGAWFSAAFAGERIPTLDEVFDAFGDKLLINVEIKSSPAWGYRADKLLAECVRRHGMSERVIVSSFDPVILRNLRQMMPAAIMGFLYQPDMPAAHYLPLKRLWHQARHPRQDMVDQGYMNWARAQRYFVNVWTVNDGERALELGRLGVNTIITDEPATIIRALEKC